MYYIFYFIKLSFSILLFSLLPFHSALLLILLLSSSLHYLIIPKLFHVEPLSLLDSFMRIENPHNRTIFGGIGIYDRIEFTKLSDLRKKLIAQHKRLRQTIVEYFGNYYFKEIPLDIAEQSLIKIEGLHTKEELERFCENACGEKFKAGEAFWKIYIVEDYNEKETAGILIMHHSLFDGLANLYLTWMYSGEPCDPSILPNFKSISFIENVYLHIKMILTSPSNLLVSLTKPKDVNPINNGRPLTGIMKYACMKDIPFEVVKNNYKGLGITLNDYFLAIISKSIKSYFLLKDPASKQTHINIAIPINLRGKYPRSYSQVKLENNFSAVDMRVPLIDDITTEAIKINKITSKMKNSAEFLTNSYLLQLGVLLWPRGLMKAFNNFITRKSTLCFSNVPYFKKPLTIENSNSKLLWTTGFFQNNGDIGLTINIMTYCDIVMVGIYSDVARMDDPKLFAEIMKKNLMQI